MQFEVNQAVLLRKSSFSFFFFLFNSSSPVTSSYAQAARISAHVHRVLTWTASHCFMRSPTFFSSRCLTCLGTLGCVVLWFPPPAGLDWPSEQETCSCIAPSPPFIWFHKKRRRCEWHIFQQGSRAGVGGGWNKPCKFGTALSLFLDCKISVSSVFTYSTEMWWIIRFSKLKNKKRLKGQGGV